MSKKLSVTDPFQPKITRNDRFAQMSHQEKIIEQKKREILAKLDARIKPAIADNSSAKSSNASTTSKPAKSTSSKKQEVKKSDGFNLFNNDGSFLDTFKQLKDRRLDSKLKSFKSKDSDHQHNSNNNKTSRWSQRRRSSSPKPDRTPKSRVSRFSDKANLNLNHFEPKITINTSSFNNNNNNNNSNNSVESQHHNNFVVENQQQISMITTQSVTGQPLLKNMLPSSSSPAIITSFATTVSPQQLQSTPSVIAAPPLLLNVPPPQIVHQTTAINQNASALVTLPVTNVLSTTPTTVHVSEVLTTTVTLPPPSIIIPAQTVTVSATTTAMPVPPPNVPTVELASIPPPNPIQIQNIPQPEPINTLNIPHPAPIQVQNIPTPASIQLNEIPNPKPLDLLTIPTPNEDNNNQSMSDPDFIKNIPPPNKSIPPPNLPESTTNINIPPPPNNTINNVSVQSTSNIISTASLPPPQSQSITATTTQTLAASNNSLTVQQQSITPCQNILVHHHHHNTLPPSSMQQQTNHLQTTSQTILTAAVPPPNTLQAQSTFASVASISVVLPSSQAMTVTNAIPSLMAQPILPPPGMAMTTMNVSCPPPLSLQQSATAPPSFINQPPPMTSQMPPMNVPPPAALAGVPIVGNSGGALGGCYRDMNTVFPPGTPDYEAMASLGRMVAQCGPGIEDVVRQRKMQDPNLWFLFHKESAAYQQYRQLIEQFTRELNKVNDSNSYKPEDIYEPEMATDDDQDYDVIKQEIKEEHRQDSKDTSESDLGNRRKRKSRWGDKDTSIPPPKVVFNNVQLVNLPQNVVRLQQPQNNKMLSKVTRTDPALVQYAMNTFGSTNLTDEEWKKAEDHYKINLLYQDMLKKREQLMKLQQSGRNKYDYDSDEDIEGGTWEHKLRDKEMMATELWATELTRQAEGKHHIGDFLPPEELKRFMEKSNASKEGRLPNFSDYKEFKIKEDNIGFKMLQKLGWSEGEGLGSSGGGIVEPVNKAASRDQNQGLGLGEDNSEQEDEYEAYRKRMMLAYRFRPNPLNNPRRPYY